MSYDVTYVDSNYNDDVQLWYEYDEYSRKFEMAIIDEPTDDNQGETLEYNRAFGVLNSA